MKVLITGADGQLGTDLCKVLKNHQLLPLTINDGDITDYFFLEKQFLSYRPDVIINTAAYVRVDDCEDEVDLAFNVNALGARNVAVAAEKIGARLVHISTDYIFGGEDNPRSVPYTEFDDPIPSNTYGKSKLAGETLVRHLCKRHFIVRSSALFGTAGAMGKGGNFIETILRLAKERPELQVVNDQVFSPTCTRDLADKLVKIMPTELFGIFHITNSGACSWYEFAVEILRLAGIKTPVIPIKSEQYPQKARRPRYSVLDNYQARLLGWDDMRPWQSALVDYMQEKAYLNR
ncbi:MAG: dTDP-4-dehydrorhamnose reductase [Chloroflexi bacterium]|nr:dTDP-4-dehydrorhamnose reductase [Chloroflexota bacterium]